MSTENPLPPRATRTHPHLGMAHAYTPLAHLNKPAIFATPTRTTASPYQKLTNMSLLPRTGSSSSLHSLTRSPAFMKTRPSASPSPSPSASTSPSPFPSPMLGSSLSSLTTSALINAHLSSSHSSLSLSTLSSLTHSPVQSATSSGTIINILSKLNSTDVDDCAFDEVDAHAYTEVSSHSSSSSSSNNSTNGECEDEDVSHMYDYGGDGSHTSGHMDSIDSSVLSVSTSSSMMSNNAASSLSYMSFGGTSHYAPQQQDMNDEYPEAAKDVPTQHHTQSQLGSGSGTQSSTTTEDNLELESASALVAAQTTSSLSKTSSLMNLKQYNTRSRRASSDHIASPYLSPLLLAVMNNEHLSSLPALSFASPALSPSLGAFSQHGNGHRTTMATTQQQHQPIHDHASSAAAASHVPLSPMSSATSGMTSMPALSPLVSPQTSPMLGSRGLGSVSLASLSTMQASWPTASPSSSPAHSGANHSYMVSGFHPQQPHHYYQQQQLLHQHHFSHTLPHYPTHPQMHPMGSMHPYQPAYYGHPHMAHGAHPHAHTHASLHEQVSVKLEPRLPMMQDTSLDMSVPRTQPSVITAAAAAVRASMPPMEPSHGTKRKLDDAQEGEPRRVKKTIPKKSVKRRKKTGNESPSSDEQDEEVQATLSGDYKYQCTYESCGDCFKTRFSLKRHLKKHTGEKPYVCGIDGCDKTFAEKSTLKRHLRIHTGEKPYQCHVPGCGKLFADRTNVKRHEMIHTGERPYWCPFASCTRGYFWRKHLRKHVSSVHHANLSALSTYAKKNKQGEIIVGSGIVATAQTVPQSREAHGRVEEEDDILDDPDHEEPDEDDDEGMGGEAMEPSPRAKSKRVTTKKTRA